VLEVIQMSATIERDREAAIASIDTTLIPTGTQYGATQGKAEKGNRLIYAPFANPCIPLQRLSDHSQLEQG
jgi:hypothetical protein